MENIPPLFPPSAHYQQAKSLLKAGQYAEAMDYLWSCVLSDPLKIAYQRAYIKAAAPVLTKRYLEQGEKLKSEGQFSELVSLYGQALKLRLDPRRFKELLRQARQMEQDFNREYQLAQELLSQEKYIKFQRQVEKLVKLSPRNQKVIALSYRAGAIDTPPVPSARKKVEPEPMAAKPKAPAASVRQTAVVAKELSLADSIQLLEDLESPSSKD